MFGIIAGAVISGAASYLSNKSSQKSAKNSVQNEIKAQKELLEQQRQYDLADRKYRQDAAGAWSKFANPDMATQQAHQPTFTGQPYTPNWQTSAGGNPSTGLRVLDGPIPVIPQDRLRTFNPAARNPADEY